MLDRIRDKVRVQYPSLEPPSLQRSIVQLSLILEDPEYYRAVGQYLESLSLSSDGSGSRDCCSNVDGGRPDSVYGGIFCAIDGGGV